MAALHLSAARSSLCVVCILLTTVTLALAARPTQTFVNQDEFTNEFEGLESGRSLLSAGGPSPAPAVISAVAPVNIYYNGSSVGMAYDTFVPVYGASDGALQECGTVHSDDYPYTGATLTLKMCSQTLYGAFAQYRLVAFLPFDSFPYSY
ncbi:hypothetical protein H632_c537p0, partial [Helicosporidium sp. ATCC 50920]